jgi:hypothetical protein
MNSEQKSRYPYPWQGSQTKSSSIPAQSVCVHMKHLARRIQSSPLWSSEKRPVQNKKSASFISSYVESSARGTASSVSECDSGFGGLGVCMLASGTQDRGFAPDRSRRIFPAGKIHSMQYDTIQTTQTTIESTIPGQWGTRYGQKKVIECQTELDPGKHFSSAFLKDQEEHWTQPIGFGFSGLFNFIFLNYLNNYFVRWIRYFLCCSVTRIWL